MLATALVWAWHYHCWTWEDWNVPTDYIGDSHETLARIQAAAEGDTFPLTQQRIERLGAPFGAYWNAYPTPDKPLMLLLGGLAWLIGLFPAANAGLLLAQLSSSLAFYFVARRLRLAWEWSWSGALLFAYCYPAFHRGLAHFSFVFTWTVPLGLLAVWLVARRTPTPLGGRAALFCLAVSAVLGAHNPYHLVFWGQLMVWAILLGWLGGRPRCNTVVGIGSLAVAAVSFFVLHAENWIFIQDSEAMPLLARNYGGTERYALKVVEMFIPPADHRWDALAFFGHRYGRWSEWRGEAFLPYLGLAGIAGLILLALETLKRLARRQPLPGTSLAVSWLIAYASIGGVTNLLAFFFSFQWFRATNRVSIFIAALALFYLMARLSHWTAAWRPRTRLAAALALATIGLLDQVPVKTGVMPRSTIEEMVSGDRDFSTRLEASLPPGAMVFQLPVLGFPEVVPPHQLSDYEHFRPYFFTETLRFSYGAAKMRARSRWQRDLESVDSMTLVRRLEAYGFGALLINRKGFEDRAQRILDSLERLGYTRRIEGRLGHQVALLLNPSPSPKLPLARNFNYGRGWYPPFEGSVRWAYDAAAVSYLNPYDRPIPASLTFKLQGEGNRTVWLSRGGRKAGEWKLEGEVLTVELKGFVLEPGINTLRFESDKPAVRRSNKRYQLRQFGLGSVSIELPPEFALPKTPGVAKPPSQSTPAPKNKSE